MNEAMLSFLAIVKAVIPYSLSWGLGIRAYNFVTDCYLGKNTNIGGKK